MIDSIHIADSEGSTYELPRPIAELKYREGTILPTHWVWQENEWIEASRFFSGVKKKAVSVVETAILNVEELQALLEEKRARTRQAS